MRTRQPGHARRGSAIIPVLFLIVAVAGMSAAVVSTSFFRQSAARGLHEQERAHEVAMTAVDLALFELREELDLTGDGIGAMQGQIGGVQYSVTIDPPFAGDGTYRLHGEGRVGAVRAAVDVEITSTVPFGVGLFGRDGISMSGSFSLDSYDSSAGTYASQFGVDHAGDAGHIASNADIQAGGGMIHGDASPGPGFQVLGDATLVTGSTAPLSMPMSYEPVVYSPPIASSGLYPGTPALAGGEYRYDEFTLNGGDTLSISGDVVLHVDGDFKLTGGSNIVLDPGATITINHGSGVFSCSGGAIVNAAQDPNDVTVVSATNQTVELSGGAEFYGGVYAPEAAFKSTGGSHLYGALVVASAVMSGSGQLHFDESLLLPTSAVEGLVILCTWKGRPTDL